MVYAEGHVKRNPESGEVAVRTMFPVGENPQEQLMEWWCMSITNAPRSTWTIEVDGWENLYVPPPSPEPNP